MYCLWEVNIYLFLFIAYVSGLKVHEYAVDIGRNISLPCKIPHSDKKNVMWRRSGKDKLNVLEDGTLFLAEVNRNDTGIYSCVIEGEDDLNYTLKLRVRTPPAALNFTVHPKTIIALLFWDVIDSGGYPIISFTAQYKLLNSDEKWRKISSTISSNTRTYEVYALQPNTTYAFRMWATNQLGPGAISEVHKTTLHNNEELELARHFLTDADKFDTRVWIVAVGVVMGTLVILGTGTCLLLYQECRTPNDLDKQEIIELVPNIILNPGFEGNCHTEPVPADENSNNETTTHLNNNSTIQPRVM